MRDIPQPPIDQRDLIVLPPESRLFGVDPDLENESGSLVEAVDVKDFDTAKKLLNNLRFIENLVIRKGDNGEYLKILIRAVNTLSREVIGKDLRELNQEELLKFLKASGLSHLSMTEINAALFHLKDLDGCMRLATNMSDSSEIEPLVRIYSKHHMASVYDRSGMSDLSRKANGEALGLIRELPSLDPNGEFIRRKVEHGLVATRAKRNPHPDMIEEFKRLLSERQKSGDVFHIGRTLLEMARVAKSLGQCDEALFYAQRAEEELAKVDYRNSLADTQLLIAQLRRNNGEDGRAKRYFGKTLETCSRLGDVCPNEVIESGKESGEKLKRPAVCLVESGGRYLLTQEDGVLKLVTVDSEKSKDSDKTIRAKLESLLGYLASLFKEQNLGEIKLSLRNSGVYLKLKQEDGENKTFFYKLELSSEEAKKLLEALDKNPKDGYISMSLLELEGVKDSFSIGEQELIQSELDRLKKK